MRVMQTNYLLPNKFKTIGWVLFLLGITFYLFLNFTKYDGFSKEISINVLNAIISKLIIIGGLLVGFTKEKIEDEFIYKLRNDSLAWAVIAYYTLLLITPKFIFYADFLSNIFTTLIFFIIRFNFLKLKSRSHEE